MSIESFQEARLVKFGEDLAIEAFQGEPDVLSNILAAAAGAEAIQQTLELLASVKGD